jgi:hypothetical protein
VSKNVDAWHKAGHDESSQTPGRDLSRQRRYLR